MTRAVAHEPKTKWCSEGATEEMEDVERHIWQLENLNTTNIALVREPGFSQLTFLLARVLLSFRLVH